MTGRPQSIDRAKVAELIGQGLTNNQIGAQLDCHGRSVHKIRDELGLAPARRKVAAPKVSLIWPPERVELLRRLWNVERLSASQIAARFGGTYTRDSIIGAVHRHKLAARPSPIKGTKGRDNNGAFMARAKSRAADATRTTAPRRDAIIFGAKTHIGIPAKALAVTAAAKAQPAANAQRVEVPARSPESSLTRAEIGALRPSPSVPHPAARNVPFAELHDRGCKFATTGHQVGVSEHRFCNERRIAGSAYCGLHTAMAVGNGTPSERRADEDVAA